MARRNSAPVLFLEPHGSRKARRWERQVFMRRGNCRRAAVLLLIISGTLFAGCGANSAAGQDTEQGEPDGAVLVRTGEELLEAVKPGAEIVLAPGRYNLSEFTRDVWAAEGEAWNERHAYVRIQDCYDGAEVVIQNVDGLSISGQSAEAAPELVIDPRYGTVLTFENCSAVRLSNLTLGHTDGGQCSGNVINLDAVRDAEFHSVDLYGCGEVGLECRNGTGGVSFYDSILHDCSSGPLFLYNCAGPISFYDCAFSDSQGGGYYEKTADSTLSFYRCSFGAEETSVWAAHEDVYTEDCVWSPWMDSTDAEDTEGTAELVFHPETLTETAFDEDTYGDTGWTGYAMTNPQTGASAAPPSGGEVSDVSLILRGDGTGALMGWLSETVPFLWKQDAERPAELTLMTWDNRDYTVTFYRSEEGTYPSIWMSVQTESARIWLY